jgi:hypothetical protein
MVLSSIVIVLIGTEITMQIYFRVWGSTEQKVLYIYSSERIQELDQRFLPMPFVGYVPSPVTQIIML